VNEPIEITAPVGSRESLAAAIAAGAGSVYFGVGKLARKYRTSIKEICAMNKIRPTTTLRIGRSIRVR